MTLRGRLEGYRTARTVAVAAFALGLMSSACGGGGGTGGRHDGGDDADLGTAASQTQITAYQYDLASRLKSATIGVNGMAPTPSGAPQFAYGYDPASNPTSITTNGAAQSVAYTSTNEIVGGNYDPNGSPKTLNGAQYTWDAANRLASATVGGVETDFSYDGLSRLVRLVSKQGGSVVSDRAYTWSGNTRLLEHDNLKSGSPVSKEYLSQGVVAVSQGYYYTRDRLGSIRQLVDANGAIHAQYTYDPYGARTKVSGDADSDIGFTGLFHNTISGLDVAGHRAYSPQSSRWLNRDPIEESGGLNLYAYVIDNPILYVDTSGDCLRLPDYVSININVAIPNPYTLTLVGWSGTASVDRYGDVFWSPLGVGVGKSATVVSGALTVNWLDQGNVPTSDQLNGFLSANGFNVTGGFIGGVSQSWTPGSGYSTGFGLVSPQIGGSYNYSFYGGNIGIAW